MSFTPGIIAPLASFTEPEILPTGEPKTPAALIRNNKPVNANLRMPCIGYPFGMWYQLLTRILACLNQYTPAGSLKSSFYGMTGNVVGRSWWSLNGSDLRPGS